MTREHQESLNSRNMKADLNIIGVHPFVLSTVSVDILWLVPTWREANGYIYW